MRIENEKRIHAARNDPEVLAGRKKYVEPPLVTYKLQPVLQQPDIIDDDSASSDEEVDEWEQLMPDTEAPILGTVAVPKQA